MEKLCKTQYGKVMVVSVTAGLALIIIQAFYWQLVDLLTVFLALVLVLAIWLIFGCSVVYSLICLWCNRNAQSLMLYLPILVQLAAVFLALKVPWTSIMLDLDFKIYLKQREVIVRKIISGDLKPNVSYNSTLILLPKGYRHLSSGGGEVVAERDGRAATILFYTFRGVLDHFSGFIYRSDGNPPQDDDVFGSQAVEVERLNQNWFWVSAT